MTTRPASGNVTVADLDMPLPRAGARLQVTYAAAFFAEQLRQTPHLLSPAVLTR